MDHPKGNPWQFECLEKQVSEIEILQAMFSGGKDRFSLEDEEAFYMAKQYLDHPPSREVIPTFPQLTAIISFCPEDQQNVYVQVECKLPRKYPEEIPFVIVRSNSFSRESQDKINQKLIDVIMSMKGEPCLVAAIQWVQECAAAYIKQPDQKPLVPCDLTRQQNFVREFLWFHHIYNREKRKHIVEWAKGSNLSGFSMAGKPGIVIVEGDERDVGEYYQRLRSLSWKKMSSKFKQREEYCKGGIDKYRKFDGFEEKSFDVHGKGNHPSLGQLRETLEKVGLGHIFAELVGLSKEIH